MPKEAKGEKGEKGAQVRFGMNAQNVEGRVVGRELHLVIDLDARHGTTANGKKARVASTRGNAYVTEEGHGLSLNLTAPLGPSADA